MGSHGFRREGSTRLAGNCRGDGFAQSFIRHAEHGALQHRRMLVDDGLHLLAANVLAAADDHVLFPVGDVNEVLRIHVANVAGAHPAFNERVGGILRAVPIA